MISTSAMKTKNKTALMMTKKLEEENKKMESRLQELKKTISKEREERMQVGNGTFWVNGQTGALNNFKPSPPAADAATKAKKISILKDEPIVVPKRDPDQSLAARILQKENASQSAGAPTRTRGKGQSCGQCEEKTAVVTCQECCEDYCAKCFAAFHLKGALRKHRSLPISSYNLRKTALSPPTTDRGDRRLSSTADVTDRTKPVPDIQSTPKRAVRIVTPPVAKSIADEVDEDERVGAVEENRGLDSSASDYDEVKATEDFKRAVMQWRQQSHTPAQTVSQTTETAGGQLLTHSNGPDLASGDPAASDFPEIKFTHSLSYAEQLLLKRHRRDQLAGVKSESGLRDRERNGVPAPSLAERDAEDEDDSDTEIEFERINFDSLCELAQLGDMLAASGSRLDGGHISRSLISPHFRIEDAVASARTPRLQFQSPRKPTSANEDGPLLRNSQVMSSATPQTPLVSNRTSVTASRVSESTQQSLAASSSRGKSKPQNNKNGLQTSEPVSGRRALKSTEADESGQTPIPATPSMTPAPATPLMTPVASGRVKTPRSANPTARRGLGYDKPSPRRPASRPTSSLNHQLTVTPSEELSQMASVAAAAASAGAGTDADGGATPQLKSRPTSATSDKAGVSKSGLSYKFYSLAPRTWKQATSCDDNPNSTGESDLDGDAMLQTVVGQLNLMNDAADGGWSNEETAELKAIDALASFRGRVQSARLTPRPQSASQREGRISRQITVDGDDMTRFDSLHVEEEEEDQANEQRLTSEINTHRSEEVAGNYSQDLELVDSLDIGRASVDSLSDFAADDETALDNLQSARFNDETDVKELDS